MGGGPGMRQSISALVRGPAKPRRRAVGTPPCRDQLAPGSGGNGVVRFRTGAEGMAMRVTNGGENLLVVGAVALGLSGDVRAERLLGISIVEQTVFKLDPADGALIKFPGHPVSNLGGLDIDSQGNLYYLGINTLRRLDLDQPANDTFIGLIPGVVFEGFEIVNDQGYAAEVFTGTMYRINLANAAI